MGLPPLPLDLIASYVGHGVNLLVRRRWGHMPPMRMLKGVWRSFWHYYREHMLDNTAPYPGVAEALEKLAGPQDGGADQQTRKFQP